MNAEQSEKKWPGNRPPIPNLLLLDQRMDATWGRGKFRAEIWEDFVNPLNDWWEAYAPSEEEAQAFEQAYDFAEPEKWFSEKVSCSTLTDLLLCLFNGSKISYVIAYGYKAVASFC